MKLNTFLSETFCDRIYIGPTAKSGISHKRCGWVIHFKLGEFVHDLYCLCLGNLETSRARSYLLALLKWQQICICCMTHQNISFQLVRNLFLGHSSIIIMSNLNSSRHSEVNVEVCLQLNRKCLFGNCIVATYMVV